MSEFSTALTEIIERSYEGNSMKLSRASSVPSSALTRLTKASLSPSTARLEELSKALNRHDRRQLLLAAARDRIPEQYQAEVFDAKGTSTAMSKGKLPNDIEAIISWLQMDALRDEETRVFIRKIGKWIGIPPVDQP